jgi:hypothetical protein
MEEWGDGGGWRGKFRLQEKPAHADCKKGPSMPPLAEILLEILKLFSKTTLAVVLQGCLLGNIWVCQWNLSLGSPELVNSHFSYGLLSGIVNRK